MAAFCGYLGLFSLDTDGHPRLGDGAGRFDGETDDQLLSAGNTAEHATGVVGKENHRPIPVDSHFVGVFRTRKFRRPESSADFHSLDGGDAHQGFGDVSVEPVENRRPQTRRNAGGPQFDHRPRRGTFLANTVKENFPVLGGLRVRAPKGIVANLVPVPAFAVDPVRSHLDQGTANLDPAAQDLAGDGAGGDANGGLAGAGAAAAAVVADAVLLEIGVIGVAGAEQILDVVVILRPGVLVGDQQGDGCAGGPVFENAGQDLHPVGFAPLTGMP